MRNSFILFYVLLIINSNKLISQIDSAVFYNYIKYSGITKVRYVTKKYSKKKIKEEGWIVYYKNAANSKIFKIKDAPPDQEYQFKVGIWKGYYKKGNIQYIDSAIVNDSLSGNILTVFDPSGKLLKKQYNTNAKEINDKYTRVFLGPGYNNTSPKAIKDKTINVLYYPNGNVKSVVNYCEGKPCDTDKYYTESGMLKKEVKH